MKSFSILRTNVGLTTNVKIICDSVYNLYLESIDSAPELSINRLKKMQFNKNNYYDELVPYFYKDFPIDIAYYTYYNGDSSNMSTDFSNQHDDLYQMGARNIIDNKNYIEEYEYFAPLYVFKNSFPKFFIIFRVDGPGLIELNSSNFRSEFLKKFKTVKIFDLTKNSLLGEWIDKNFKNNSSFPNSPIEVDFRSLEFSKWFGIDYESGGFTYKSSYLENSIKNENTLFDFEKLFFDGFKSNKIIFPNILNFSFLFDDNPATKTSLRKWSMNRYSGFYLEDLVEIDSITPFIMPTLKEGFTILDENILYHESGDPFLNGFKEQDMLIEYKGYFYKVETFIEENEILGSVTTKNSIKRVLNEKISKIEVSKSLNQETVKKEEYLKKETIKFRIISEFDLSGLESEINTKTCYVDSNNNILLLNGSTYSIVDFEESDVNLIEIDGKYHNLILENGYLKINSDYGFNFKESYRFEYFINSPDPNYYNYIDLSISESNSPKSFKIFRAKFTDIKDFDTQIIDTEFSKYEYESIDTITETEETKMYTTDLRINSNPPNFNDYKYNNEVVLLPSASDYTANLETFRLVDDDISPLWRKNPIHCRFGFQKSLSTSDYPYLLNNNDIHENFNRTVDTFKSTPDRKSRNLDYFYTINSGTFSYIHHSLHIEKNYSSQDSSFNFELDKYLNLYTYSTFTYSSNYFNYFFGSTQSFYKNEIVKNVQKYSYFDFGDKSTPNMTVFRGLKFKLFEVDSIVKNEISIENLNLYTSNKFDNYKFSILLSQNFKEVDIDGNLSNIIYHGYFIDNQFDNGDLAFKTSENATPSNIMIGDIVEINQSYPGIPEYEGKATVTYVGGLSLGGYGFVTDKAFTNSTSAAPGYYKVKMQWKVIKNWEIDFEYKIGDYVFYDSILYKVITDNKITTPNIDPSNSDYYEFSTLNNPFWNPNYVYSENDWCYINGEYYYRNEILTGIDFWSNIKTYSKGDIVSWYGKYYRSNYDNNIKIKPFDNNKSNDISESSNYWVEIPNPLNWYAYEESFSSEDIKDIWTKIPVWDNNEKYFNEDYVYQSESIFKCISDDILNGDEPGKSSNWEFVYSFEVIDDKIYSDTLNPIVKISDVHYLCTFNRDLKLNSGINIYINEKFKNVFINISINDNTTSNIENCERDILYNEVNSRLTAANFIRQINDLDSKYDFSNYTSYVVIGEDGAVSKYNFDNNIESLPYLIICEDPDSFELSNNTLVYKAKNLTPTDIKSLKYLVDGNIETIDKINYFNSIPISCEIDRVYEEVDFGKNYNGRSNITINKNSTIKPKSNSNISETFYRHSGNYMPIFYNIELFKSYGEYDVLDGNYKFDENLTMFGILKQRIISKVNRKENILKLKNNDTLKSIYPMLDEFGYTLEDFFIFKSSWDFDYHVECSQPNSTLISNLKPQRILMINKLSSKNKISDK